MRTTALALACFLLAPIALADLINPHTSAPMIVIPVAGDAPGANGTYFRSDITVVNMRDIRQVVQFRWLPQGGGPGAIVSMAISARSGIVSEDFVRNTLHQTGIGAIQISGLGDNGMPDPNAELHATARIWTPTPNNTSGGTMSQTFPAMLVSTDQSVSVKWIFGVRRDERYRLNVGVANPSSVNLRFRITVVTATAGTEQTDIDVPAGGMQQIAMPGTAPVSQVIIQNITSILPGVIWYGWASSIDNISGDAWSQTAFPAPAQ